MEERLGFWDVGFWDVDRENNPKCTCCSGSSKPVDFMEKRSSRDNPKGPESLQTMVCSIGRAPLIFSCNLPVSDSFEPMLTELDEGMNIGELEETKEGCSKEVL